MSLRDDASLILIPSAIKDGEVLVQKPLPNKFSDETGNYDGNDPQGSANLTFTRNSNATRVDANGLVEKVRTNSLLRSQEINDPYWSSNRASISANTTDTLDPFGANNAEKITQLSGFTTAPNFNRGSIAGAGIYTASLFAKKGTFNFIGFAFDGVTYFNLNNGTIGTTASGHIAKIEDYGNGWYRCSVAKNLTTTTAYAIYPCSTDGTLTTPDNEDYAYVFGAQLEQGLVATSYIETTTTAMSEFAGVTASSVANVPRLDYSGGSCPSLLLEPQRTNIITHSEYIENWSIKTGITVSSNETVSPEGLINATKIETSSAGSRYVGNNYTLATGNNTFSVFAKKGSTNWIYLNVVQDGSNNWNYTFDLENGVIGQSISSAYDVEATIEDYGSGWYRLTATANVTSAGLFTARFYPADSATDVNTDIGDSVYIYGAMLEAGSYPTSYIPTYGTTVTRLADACSKTGISSLIGQTEGTLFAEVDFDAISEESRFFQISDGTNNNRFYIGALTNNNINYTAITAGTTIVNINSSAQSSSVLKVAAAYANNDFVLYMNGTQIGADTTGTIPAMSQVSIGYNNLASNRHIAYGINQAVLFPTRLSNADLANLTTL